jgi:hypothetical protein
MSYIIFQELCRQIQPYYDALTWMVSSEDYLNDLKINIAFEIIVFSFVSDSTNCTTLDKLQIFQL